MKKFASILLLVPALAFAAPAFKTEPLDGVQGTSIWQEGQKGSVGVAGIQVTDYSDTDKRDNKFSAGVGVDHAYQNGVYVGGRAKVGDEVAKPSVYAGYIGKINAITPYYVQVRSDYVDFDKGSQGFLNSIEAGAEMRLGKSAIGAWTGYGESRGFDQDKRKYSEVGLMGNVPVSFVSADSFFANWTLSARVSGVREEFKDAVDPNFTKRDLTDIKFAIGKDVGHDWLVQLSTQADDRERRWFTSLNVAKTF